MIRLAALALIASPAFAQDHPATGSEPSFMQMDAWELGPTPNGLALLRYFNSTRSETTTFTMTFEGVEVEVTVIQTPEEETLIVRPLVDGHFAIPPEQEVGDGDWTEVLIVSTDLMM